MSSYKKIIRTYFGWAYRMYIDYKYRSKKMSYGLEYKDKTFYVIGQDDELGGLWWLLNKVLMHLAYCQDKGYTPVVDFLNFKNQYQSNDSKGINVWESFFLQPDGYSLEEISRAHNVIINKKTAYPEKKYEMGNFYDDPQKISYFHEIYEKYIKFSPELNELIKKTSTSIMPVNKTVLGVLCRGTDYVTHKPSGHPIQPEPALVLIDALALMKEKKCDYLFLATEDLDVLELFKGTLGEKLLYLDQERISKSDMKDGFLSKEKERMGLNKSPIEEGMTYFTATYILSKCDYFLGCRCGGTKGVLIMNPDIKGKHIYNLGMYK